MEAKTLDQSFYHYGVLGMKWGVRKDRISKADRSRRKDLVKNYKLSRKGARSYRYVRDQKTHEASVAVYKKSYDELKSYVDSFVKKYGDENVKSLKPTTINLGRGVVEDAFKMSNITIKDVLLGGPVSWAIDSIKYNRMVKDELYRRQKSR